MQVFLLYSLFVIYRGSVYSLAIFCMDYQLQTLFIWSLSDLFVILCVLSTIKILTLLAALSDLFVFLMDVLFSCVVFLQFCLLDSNS